MSVRVFHYSEGRSHKFWSITVDGNVQTVRFGRIATAGQMQAKTFATEGDATGASKKLIQEKMKKGYAEVAPETARAAAPKRLGPRKACQQLLLPF